MNCPAPIEFLDYDAQWSQLDDFIRFHPGARHRRRLIGKLLTGLRFETVLDAGCGLGEMLLLLKSKFPQARLCGSEISEVALEKNRRMFPDVEFFNLDLERGHLPRKFDLVICSEVLEHLTLQGEALKNLSAMVNSGGHLVLTCPHGRIFATERHFGHQHHPTAAELVEQAAAADLQMISLARWGWPLYLGLKYLTNINPQAALKGFAEGRYSWKQRWISNVLYWVNFLNLSDSLSGCQTIVVFVKR